MSKNIHQHPKCFQKNFEFLSPYVCSFFEFLNLCLVLLLFFLEWELKTTPSKVSNFLVYKVMFFMKSKFSWIFKDQMLPPDRQSHFPKDVKKNNNVIAAPSHHQSLLVACLKMVKYPPDKCFQMWKVCNSVCMPTALLATHTSSSLYLIKTHWTFCLLFLV